MLVRLYYRGPSMEHLSPADRDVCLIEDGRLDDDEMRRLHINAGELIAKAHERGFDSLDEVESAIALSQRHDLLPRAATSRAEAARHRELLRRLDALGAADRRAPPVAR